MCRFINLTFSYALFVIQALEDNADRNIERIRVGNMALPYYTSTTSRSDYDYPEGYTDLATSKSAPKRTKAATAVENQPETAPASKKATEPSNTTQSAIASTSALKDDEPMTDDPPPAPAGPSAMDIDDDNDKESQRAPLKPPIAAPKPAKAMKGATVAKTSEHKASKAVLDPLSLFSDDVPGENAGRSSPHAPELGAGGENQSAPNSDDDIDSGSCPFDGEPSSEEVDDIVQFGESSQLTSLSTLAKEA